MIAQQRPRTTFAFSTLAQFHEAAWPIIEAFDNWDAQAFNVGVGVDHICYQCGSSVEFDHVRRALERESKEIRQFVISEQRVAIVELSVPVSSSFLGTIRYVKIVDQKPGGTQKAGFTHIAIVPVEGTLEGLVKRCKKRGDVVTEIVPPFFPCFEIKIGNKQQFSIHIAWDYSIAMMRHNETGNI